MQAIRARRFRRSGLLPFKPKRARPYLYTDEEIEQLLHATLHMPLSPKQRNTCALLPWVYYCLFGLLSVSGLRLGEARNLKLEDVDLRAGVLTVRGGKFGKDRWVPLHPSTCKVLTQYLDRRERHWAGRSVSSYLFVSSWGNRLDVSDSSGVLCRLAADRPARRPRQPWAAPARSSPSICHDDLGQLVSLQ